MIATDDDREMSDEPIQRVDVNEWTDEQFVQRTRFTRRDIQRIINAMQLPASFSSDNTSDVNTFFAMTLLLRRLSYPIGLKDLQHDFGYHFTTISHILSSFIELLVDRYDDLVELWPGITPQSIQHYANVITAYEPVVSNIWACIDGTFRFTCRPGVMQRASYSGHKRHHGQKYQSIVTPDGLIVSLMGPFGGNRHDIFMLHDSDIMYTLRPMMEQGNDRYYLYGDLAYCGMPGIMAPYIMPRSTLQKKLNTLYSSIRMMVEHGFKKVVQYFAFVDYHKNQKIHLQATASYYKLSVLFTNIHSCIYSNQIATKFHTLPPTVEEYLNPTLLQ